MPPLGANADLPLPVPLRALEPGLLRPLLESAHLRRFRRGDLIFSSGETANAVFCLRTGMIKLIRNRPQGPRIVHLALPGDMVGMASILAERPFSLSALALTTGEMQILGGAQFVEAIGASRSFCEAVLRQMSQDLTGARESLALQGDLPVPARLARLLLDLHARAQADPSGSSPVLRLTRYDLAEILGTAQETISRSLGQLENAGLLLRVGRAIQVKDDEALRTVGDSDRSSVSHTLEILRNRHKNA